MSTGWVYVLSNPSIPNKVKVGWTNNRPESRAKELQSTGVPTPFKVETAMLFANKAEQIEHKKHDILSRNRVSSNREWFDCDASIAAGSILKAAEFFHEEVLTTDALLLSFCCLNPALHLLIRSTVCCPAHQQQIPCVGRENQ
jgi:hypothetical protein